jgi:hypothetical protein
MRVDSRTRRGVAAGWHAVLRADRSRARLVLACLGAFLLTAGLLLRLIAAPALIAAPDGVSETLTLTDPHGSYFNESALKSVSNVPLTYVSTVRGDAAAGTSTVAVWDFSSVLEDLKHHSIVQDTYQRAAFNRRTAQMVDCCGASVNDDTSVRQYGVAGLYWPIGLGAKTYNVFDVATERAWPAVYAGTAVVQGISTQVFVQRIPSTLVQTIPDTPLKILGVPGVSYNVTARRLYQAVNTYWIDPRTGVPVNVQEKISSTLTDPAGDASLTVASADLKLATSGQQTLAALSRNTASQLSILRVTGPLVGIIGGALLLAAALIPWRRARRARPGPSPGPGR